MAFVEFQGSSCFSCLVLSRGNFLLRVVSGILSAMFFLINFIGVNFEAGNEPREKFWSDFVAEQNEEWSEKRVVFVHIAVF